MDTRIKEADLSTITKLLNESTKADFKYCVPAHALFFRKEGYIVTIKKEVTCAAQ